MDTPLRPIADVASDLGIDPAYLVPYGRHFAKVSLEAMESAPSGAGRLVLVSAITPTPAGEGKTTTTIGLGQALRKMGERVCLALREPSLGPCFGIKGGGTGGGLSTIEPKEQINLHFTGDFHAITAAHNLLAAMIDNHLHFGNELEMDPRRVLWPRVLDVNDRALRDIVVGLGGSSGGIPRQGSFDITAASEVMAILCLAESPADLRARIARIIVARRRDGSPVTADDLGATGAMMALLQDAMVPNLTQTVEGCPALVHGGPFANIAHGCNSVLATRMALHHADWVITEAGFGFDLGAEKFFDIKCVGAGLMPVAVVLVATVRALKMHGGVALADLTQVDAAAVERGLPNLGHHLDSVAAFGKPAVVAINHRKEDDPTEVAVIRAFCEARGVAVAESRHFAEGGAGAMELAAALLETAEREPTPFVPVYDRSEPVPTKIRKIATKIYGARDIVLSKEAERDLAGIRRLGLSGLPICMAKTQSSLSDDPRLIGRPVDFDINIRRVQVNAGAGFLVVLTGDMMRMPGLPRRPSALDVDLVDGKITGIG